jgi:DNA-binding SARP family transcriptional activator
MRRSFRFTAPDPRRDALIRPRLLRSLLGRWEHRVTVVTGGAGFGKTTLLAQSVAENRLTPRGEDVWIGVEPSDALGDALGEAAAHALAAGAALDTGDTGSALALPDALAVARMVWQRSPRQVCLVLDDVHLLPCESAGAEWLGSLIDVLPDNGHVLLASRTEPAVPLARLDGLGVVLRLHEDDLRLSPDEQQAFAERSSIEPAALAPSGGWPAMAALAAMAPAARRQRSDAYLWEEVLRPLGPDRRRVLAVVADLGGADDALASAALGAPVDVARALGDVPLVAEGADGWFVPHALWRTAHGMALEPAAQAEVRRRAVRHLVERRRLDEAFTLVTGTGLWDVAPVVLRAASLSSERLDHQQLDRCLASTPTDVRATPEGKLALALHQAFTQPSDAIARLREAAEACREAGDIEAEVTALAQLGRLAWGRHDAASIGALVATRIAEITAAPASSSTSSSTNEGGRGSGGRGGSGGAGQPTARGLAAFVRALAADLDGDDHAVLAELDAIEPGALDPVWQAMVTWLAGGVRLFLGDAERVQQMADALPLSADPSIIAIVGGLRVRARWALGHIDEAVDEVPDLLEALRVAGVSSIQSQGLTNASLAFSYVGDVERARACLAEAASAGRESADGLTVRTALARASVELAEGDEDGAVGTLRAAVKLGGGPDLDPERRALRHVLSLTYVLLPETRAHWDGAPLRGHLLLARELARAVVISREDPTDERLWRVAVPELRHVKAALHHRLAADLAVGLTGVGRPEGARLLDALGPAGRVAVQDLARQRPRQTKAAKSLLVAVPAPPPVTTHLSVLGPLTIWRTELLDPDAAPASGLVPGTGRDVGRDVGRDEVGHPDLRRSRVRALLAFLMTHRRTRRAAITAALWPDLDDRAASNNLAVNLNHLLSALEPWRTRREPPYLVRLDGPSVELMTGPYLQVDIDAFDDHLRRASRAEAEGSPSVALDHLLAAAALYRGELFSDIPEAEWVELDRAHYGSRFVATATRAAELLVGRGDYNEAEDLVSRALGADPWSEDAYAVLASAALGRGDRSAARRTLRQCLDALADLGAAPSRATRELGHRCGFNEATLLAARHQPVA